MASLEARGIRKAYGGVVALKGVDFEVQPGSVHALLGENGAGKSTLVKIMTGAVRADSGTLKLDGTEASFVNTANAVKHGVAVVAQELSLFPHLDILDNMFPMREPRMGPLINRQTMRELATPILEELGIDRPITTMVSELSLAERQLVEIAKALVASPRVLLLDEPTSALETGAADRLLKILRILRDRNVAVVFVSHILEEVMSLCDQVTVLRDGSVVLAGADVSKLSIHEIVDAMLGKTLEADCQRREPETPATDLNLPSSVVAPVAHDSGLNVSNVSSAAGLHAVSLKVKRGEVIGLSGLDGSGANALLRAVAGLAPINAGQITLPGGRPRPRNFRQAIASGVAFVSGDRRKLGLMLDKPIWENIVQVTAMGLAREGWFLRAEHLKKAAGALANMLGVRAASVNAPAGSLSGGNQQKVVVAKWLNARPSVILLDDPTRGVDVGARAEINGLLRKVAEEGAVVIYSSTDLEELANSCDRVYVFFRGEVCAELTGASLTPSALLEVMNTGAPILN